ncbi:MAG: NAD(P)/FAD-dependent oxidoreductase [Chitinophagaceae bacterium]|nr:NAD(P)/FAD-dependent oxidoreductase [Chitinophagaceae bacterium]
MQVVIVGGGFAGLRLAQRLNNKEGVDVLMINKFNFHQFQPLFYQVATAALDASNISFPLRKAFHHSRNIRFRLTELTSVSPAEKKITTTIGDFNYDILVLATGADTNFFGNVKLQNASFPMKSTVEAVQLRHRLLETFEKALVLKENPVEFKKLMTIVITGGGPTGVELSGAIAEMRNNILPKDYPELDFKQMKIFLLEGSGKLLASMSEESSKQSKYYLDKLGVDVMLNTIVSDYDGEQVTLKDGATIPAKTVIWAAGIRGNVPDGIDPSFVVRGNRIKVDRFNQVIGLDNIYALGDVAYMETSLFPHGHPQVANVALNQAKNLGDNILRAIKGERQLEEFEYHDKGSMATVGRNLAVVDMPKPKLHFGGFFAWMIWMGLHLFLLLGVKNRIQVFINWIYKYFTYDQSLRLLVRDERKPWGEVRQP